jgi:hypothetical protein
VLQAGSAAAAVAGHDAEPEVEPAPRPDKAAPAGPVDSMGVPGLFCLWIPKYWGRVWSVFSLLLQSLQESSSIHPNITFGKGAANSVNFVTYSSNAGTSCLR